MSGEHDHDDIDRHESRLDGLDDDLRDTMTIEDTHALVRELASGIRLLVNRVVMGEGPLGVNDSELIQYLATLDALDSLVAET